MIRTLFLLLLVALICVGSVSAQAATYNFSPLDYPGAIYTVATGIYGGKIVGWYQDAGYLYHGFLFDGTNYTPLNYPGATSTFAKGIDGSNIVGYYTDAVGSHGFRFDGTNYIPLNYPGALATFATGIDGSNIVGEYFDAVGEHGFRFDGTNYIPLNYPGASLTVAWGIDGSNIVGEYFDAVGGHGFLFNGTNYTSFDYPGAIITAVFGIDGGNFVGAYSNTAEEVTHGFLFDGTNYTPLDYPGASSTAVFGIDGSNIVGEYDDAVGRHGFLASPITPSQQIGNILLFFDSSASAGTLVGSGPGNSAKGRLKALNNMLVAADHFISAGDTASACQQLLDAYQRTDGMPKPPDFVAGEAASELGAMIQDLRMGLGCH